MQLAVKLVTVPHGFFTNIICITLAYSEKIKNDISHDLHAFATVISEAVVQKGSFIKKVFLSKIYQIPRNDGDWVSFMEQKSQIC